MSTASINETRPGLALPPREAKAIGKLLCMEGVGLGDVDGGSAGLAVVRFARGWPEANVVHGLVVPPFVDGHQRLVHGWAIETSEDDRPPLQIINGTAVLHRYRDGEVRIVPTTPEGEGVRPDQLAAAHYALREFADLASDPVPEYTDEAAYRMADSLPDAILSGAARWMLDDAVARKQIPASAPLVA